MWNYPAQKLKKEYDIRKNKTNTRGNRLSRECTSFITSVERVPARNKQKIEQKVEEYRQRYVSMSEEKETEYKKLLIAERQYIAVIDVIKFINEPARIIKNRQNTKLLFRGFFYSPPRKRNRHT